MTKIYLVRHGESVNNKAGVIGGDSPLTTEGIKQAILTRKALKGIRFDAAYSSNLKRAVETAQIISEKPISLEHQLNSLRERDFGSLNSKSSKFHDEEHIKRMDLTHEENWVYKHVYDMESDDELSTRFMMALQEIAEKNHGKTILIAAHGAAIRTTLMKLLGVTYRDLPQGSFKNAGYVELQYSNKKFKVVNLAGPGSKI